MVTPVIGNNKPAFSLADAVTLYHRYVDQTHKYWNYLWLASIAMLTISATANVPNLRLYLLIGFITFALGNAYLIYFSQSETGKVAYAIKQYLCCPPETIHPEFKKLLVDLSAWPALLMVLFHLIMDAAVVVGICKLARG